MSLILTRRPQESIDIINEETGEVEMKITVLAIKGNQCRVGIDAPKSKTILRSEVKDRKQRPAKKDKDKPMMKLK